jgi:hypothetical protein
MTQTNEERNATQKDYYQKHKEQIKANNRAYAKQPEIKEKRRIRDKKYRESNREKINKWQKKYNQTPQGQATKKRAKIKYMSVATNRNRVNSRSQIYKQERRLKILSLIADAYKKDVKCFCCGLTENTRTRVLEVDHRLPRSVLKERFPYVKAMMNTLTHEEYMQIYTECVTNYNAISALSKLDIKRHFAILCDICNKQVWIFGTCYVKGHKHWKKSSKWLDKFYGVSEYRQEAQWINQTNMEAKE